VDGENCILEISTTCVPANSPASNWPKNPTKWIFTGLRGINLDRGDEVDLGDGFFLSKPNDFLLSARWRYAMNEHEYQEAARASRYLVHRRISSMFQADGPDDRHRDSEMIQNALMAFQIIKPIQTLGFTFRGMNTGAPTFYLETMEQRPPMDAGEWARMRLFDQELLDEVPSMIKRVRGVMEGTSAELKNAVIFLQLGLEHSHPLIAGLLWVMGMEAIFDSEGRNDFKEKLCRCLGPTTFVFPDWNSPTPAPSYPVEDLAIPIYMLRNKLAHGADLRTAVLDKSTPVDLTKKVKLANFSEVRSNANLLSEAACYLLCQVLQKTI
jgi:hypothetical protein